MPERSFHSGSAVETLAHSDHWHRTAAEYSSQLSQAKSQLKYRSRHLGQWPEKTRGLLTPEYEIRSADLAVKQLLGFYNLNLIRRSRSGKVASLFTLPEWLFSDGDHSVGVHRQWDPIYNLGRLTDSGSKGLDFAHHSAFSAFCTTGML
jgi:hypothetical protein